MTVGKITLPGPVKILYYVFGIINIEDTLRNEVRYAAARFIQDAFIFILKHLMPFRYCYGANY
jgi:hypothetical protein